MDSYPTSTMGAAVSKGDSDARRTLQANAPMGNWQRELRALNADYLELLATESFIAAPHFAETVSELAALPSARLAALATCPCALFETTLPRHGDLHVGSHARGVIRASRRVDFARNVLFYLWHTVRENAFAARFAFGLQAAAIETLLALSIVEVGRLSEEVAQSLRPRWARHPQFWPELVRHAAQPSSVAFAAAKALGVQLLAQRGAHSLGRANVISMTRPLRHAGTARHVA